MSGVFPFFLGLVVLVAGAEVLVRGASRLAAALGVSPLVVGLTVVALGTSTPEMAISIGSAVDGRADLALGNVVGSNIANVLLILGVSALVAPLVVGLRLIRIEVPVMIGLSLATLLMALDGVVDRYDGLALIGGLAVYVTATVLAARRARRTGPRPMAGRRSIDLAMIVLGVTGLVFGASLVVDGATSIARGLGVSELVVGLTLVAVGTSLPELVTSVLAVVRGERDIGVGNVLGSNILNLLAVLGPTALVAPAGVPVARGALDFDLPVMTAVAIACLPIFATGHRISRWEGLLFLGYYGAYVGYLLLQSTQHDALEPYSAVMLRFVVPLTLLGLAVPGVRWLRRHRPAASPGG